MRSSWLERSTRQADSDKWAGEQSGAQVERRCNRGADFRLGACGDGPWLRKGTSDP
jgi:hypothetical protein